MMKATDTIKNNLLMSLLLHLIVAYMHFECMCHTHMHILFVGHTLTLLYKMNNVDIF